MPRLRLGVALLLTGELATEVDGLRRACGDGALGRVPPHLTLVPPVNVRVDELPDALSLLRAAAAATLPFALRLGPPATFLPATPTLHLAVGGSGPATQVLRQLRDGVFRPPFERILTFPFVPHVTLADEMEPDRIASALAALRDFVADLPVDRVHLLQETRGDDGQRRWVAIADAPLAPPIVVGRGGVELDLAVSRLLDPEAAAFEARAWAEGECPPVRTPAAGTESVGVVARRRGEVAGVARGWAGPSGAELVTVVVAPSQRRQGIARHLVAAFDNAAQTSS
ncbi:MAG TPA: GNAT family N-acetyltransferase [Acidimicrobiales bacterium]